jgi:hypothetical protein
MYKKITKKKNLIFVKNFLAIEKNRFNFKNNQLKKNYKKNLKNFLFFKLKLISRLLKIREKRKMLK